MTTARGELAMASGSILGIVRSVVSIIWEDDGNIVTDYLSHSCCCMSLEAMERRFLLLRIPKDRPLRLLKFLDEITGTHQ